MNSTHESYDVIVTGAGPAGCVAALQAARAGARTLLLEKSSMPGGTTTIGGVNFPGLFHAWGRQVIAGIGWELVSKAVEEAGETFPDFSRFDLPHWKLQILINPFLYACLLEEAFTQSGVKVLYHAMPTTAEEDVDGVSISVAAKEGIRNFRCRIAIDTTGDADLVAMAGHRLVTSPTKQPATPMVRFGGYSPADLDMTTIEQSYQAEITAGKMHHLDTGMSRSMANLLRNHGENCIHIPVPDATTSADKSSIEQQGRTTILRIYRFLKRFPGLEHLKIEYLAPQCGVRETSTIVGKTTITVEDYIAGKHWADSICNAFYQIDLHVCDKAGGLMAKSLQPGTVPTVPRGALLPITSKRMMAAGRCVSSDRLANSALRVQASCMAMGQAAGAMAALAVRQNLFPEELDITEVKELLRQHGAITP